VVLTAVCLSGGMVLYELPFFMVLVSYFLGFGFVLPFPRGGHWDFLLSFASSCLFPQREPTVEL
jgi:hypothetical protein